MLPATIELNYRELRSNNRILLGKVQGRASDDLSRLVLKYSPVEKTNVSIPYRIETADKAAGFPIIGSFNGSEVSTNEHYFKGLSSLKVVFYFLNQEVGALDINT